LLKINGEGILLKQMQIKIKKDEQYRGIIRSCYGIVDGNMLFSVFSLKSRMEEIYSLFLPSLLEKTENESYLVSLPLINIQKEVCSWNNCVVVGSLNSSVDGGSFQRYCFVQEKTVRNCRKEKY
jgi:hypothetical protein